MIEIPLNVNVFSKDKKFLNGSYMNNNIFFLKLIVFLLKL